MYRLPQEGAVMDPNQEGKRGQGSSMLFVARNRFAVFLKQTQVREDPGLNHLGSIVSAWWQPNLTTFCSSVQTIEVRDLSFNVTKSCKAPVQTNDIFYGGTACVILAGPSSVSLFDLQQQKVLSELPTLPVKYVVWSGDNSMVALLGKHSKSAVVACTQNDVALIIAAISLTHHDSH